MTSTGQDLTHSTGISREQDGMNTTPERWLPVVGWEGYYSVSDHGNIRSEDRTVQTVRGPRRYKGKPRKIAFCTYGYPHTILSRNGETKNSRIHRLVLLAFVGPCPDGMETCHNDGDRTNNHVSNLRWDTLKENSADMTRHGTHYGTTRTHCPQGHEYTDANTYLHRGSRSCKACHRVSNRLYARRVAMSNSRKKAA